MVGDKLHCYLLDTLLPSLELVTFLLGELRGLASCPPAALPALHLSPSLFRQLELLSALLLIKGEQLRLDVLLVLVQYRSFFSWLLMSLRGAEAAGGRAEGAAAAAGGKSEEAGGVASPAVLGDVMAFLRGQYKKDLVGLQLQVRKGGMGLWIRG